jgi:hypothetical protein
VQPSSLVFVAIIVGWAAYLLPQWLRRRDALGESRGWDRHSSGLRVLSRRPRTALGPSTAPLLPDARTAAAFPSDGAPASRPSAAPTPGWTDGGVRRPAVNFAAGAGAARASALRAAAPRASGGGTVTNAVGAARVGAARVAAARRRVLVLSILLTSTAVSWLLGSVTGVSWAAAPATALLLLDLLALVVAGRRRALRRAAGERQLQRAAARRRAESRSARAAAAASRSAPAGAPAGAALPGAVAAPTSPRPERASERVARELASGDGTWIPVPVPPPTYTLKPMAPRPGIASPAVTGAGAASRITDPATDTPIAAAAHSDGPSDGARWVAGSEHAGQGPAGQQPAGHGAAGQQPDGQQSGGQQSGGQQSGGQPTAEQSTAGHPAAGPETGARRPRPWDEDRTFADDLDLDAVLARRRAVNG